LEAKHTEATTSRDEWQTGIESALTGIGITADVLMAEYASKRVAVEEDAAPTTDPAPDVQASGNTHQSAEDGAEASK